MWGAATSAHQVEGSNINNDWWEWERKGGAKDLSVQATRHYELFEQDFALAKGLGHNAHRFSIEWSRIEPREGEFNETELAHYKAVLSSLRRHSLEPIVTLHHFTNPQWFSKKGGWLNPKAADYFLRYVKKIVESFGADVHFWLTINEPEVYAFQSYFKGVWPPCEQSFSKATLVMDNLISVHKKAYKKIRAIYRANGWPAPQVSLAKNMMVFKACPLSKDWRRYLSVFLRNRYFNEYILKRIKRHIDFIAVNYYVREFISTDAVFAAGITGACCNKVHGHVKEVDAMGWDSCPEGLYETLRYLKKYRKPIFITENGTCVSDDQKRWEFIRDHLKEVEKVISEKTPVIGYLYWSLLDNFEWHHGFGPRFGLVEVNYQNFERKLKPSALKFAQICRNNQL